MNVFIIGSGRVGSELAKLLSIEGHNVIVIDNNPDALKKLGSTFNGLQIIGSGTDEALLRDNKAQDADVFLALTDKDNINIMASQVAKYIFKVPKVIAKVNDTKRETIINKNDINIVSGTHFITAYVWNEIVQKPYKICGHIPPDIKIVKFEAIISMGGKTINEIEIEDSFKICGIIRKNATYLNLHNMKISVGDEIIAITKSNFLNKLEEILS